MIELTLDTLKGRFFDRLLVTDAAAAAERAALSRFGAFVRTRARTSIRKRKGISAPGAPPSSHVGLLRQLIVFAYDPAAKSVVIGPTLLGRAGRPGAGTVPQLLERGGATIIDKLGQSRQAHYRARPYMQPAFAAELPGAAALFKDSVRK